jgi:hypothetical protein
MKLILTKAFTLDTTGVLIRKGATAGDGVIPSGIDVAGIFIEPVSESDVIEICGITEGSDWLPQRAGVGYRLDRIMDDDKRFLLVRAASSTVAVHMHVEGS